MSGFLGALEQAGVKAEVMKTLSAEQAWAVRAVGFDAATSGPQVRAIAERYGFDLRISRAEPVKCKLLVADMEATIILDEMLDLMARDRGIGEAVAEITARTMAGELDFEQSLRHRTRLFAGTTQAELEALSRRIHIAPGARSLVQTMRATGATTVLATGGFGIFADEVARICGFDMVYANHPVMQGGVMTGELHDPAGTGATKKEVLLSCCAELGIDPQMACCIGDGANDIEMLQACGLPASYMGKPIVREIVELDIAHGDLTALLYAQGYARSDIVQNS